MHGVGLSEAMRKLLCQGKVRYWALGISVVVHAAALGVFAGVKLSNLKNEQTAATPSISMQMVKKVIEQPKPVPKPKVETIPEPKPEILPEPERAVKPLIVEDKPTAEPAAEPQPLPVVEAEPVEPVHEVEFFGQRSIAQRICFVVDCSGSMYGQMYRVKRKLKDTLNRLNPQQAFCVLFFMEGRQILMTGSGRLERATVDTKSQSFELINRIKPGGSTDAAHALECAMQLRDSERYGPEVIYFLTDGFNLDESGSQLFVEKVQVLRNSLAPSTVLNTIGFWPQERDRQMLQELANITCGVYTEVQ